MHLPKKYRNHGLHVWCNQCKRTVTHKPCPHKTKHTFQSRIWNPQLQRVSNVKSWSTANPAEAFKLHQQYKAKLIKNNFLDSSSRAPRKIDFPYLLASAVSYLDWLQDIDVPAYEQKNRSKSYIADTARYINRFLATVKSRESTVQRYPVDQINAGHVEAFHLHVKSMKLSNRSYNAHMLAARYFFDYVIKELKVKMSNPFAKLKLKHEHYDPQILTEEEIEKLFSVITPENGIGYKGTQNTKVNYYRPWLRSVFHMALLIGERLDGLVHLKWKDVKGNYIYIPNWKVNRIQKSDHYHTIAPITLDLAELLMSCEPGQPDDFILVPGYENRETLKKFITKAFTHYWRVTGIDKNVSFKNLRKTYITRMIELLGEKAGLVHHTNSKVMMKNYLEKKSIYEPAAKKRLFRIPT